MHSFKKGSVDAIGIVKMSAGWVVARHSFEPNSLDVLAGAFKTVDEAVVAATQIFNREIAELGARLADGQVVK